MQAEDEPQYVSTNVELEWEEHHYIEARYRPTQNRLRIAVNGSPIYDGALLIRETVTNGD